MIENSMVIGPYYDEGPIPGLERSDEYDSLRDEPDDEDLEDSDGE